LDSGSSPPACSTDNDERQQALKICREVLAPLVRADGGVLYLVSVAADDVHIHLAGTCSGCPGATITRDRMLEPLLRTVLPKARLRLTTGWRIPPEAEKVE
jgi:Fe-S cluster biogenesis protein NfuA